MEPLIIHFKENVPPTSYLHSEKIRISRDTAIFQIKSEVPQGGAKFSSRYEIYNSTTRPFGKSYRELTLSSSASCVSSESQSSLSSSGGGDTTTYITCCSEIEPVQMTGFQCIDETTQCHTVSILNAENYDHIHEATNYEVVSSTKSTLADAGSKCDIVADKKEFPYYTNTSESGETDHSSSCKQLVSIESWSSSVKEEPPLKAPKLLKQMISDFEYQDQLLYKIPKSPDENAKYNRVSRFDNNSAKAITSCMSMLNVEPKQPQLFSIDLTTKTSSELNLVDEKSRQQQEKERITKTISVMLENRQKQFCHSSHLKDIKPPHNALANNILTNNNIEVIERPSANTLDRGCRVTGEVLKNKVDNSFAGYYRNACTLPRTIKSHRSQLQRHFYYPLHITKSSSRVRDDELPDPDKVKHVRELFEKVLKNASLENMDSLSKSSKKEHWLRPMPQIRQADSGFVHSKLHKCFGADTGPTIHSFKLTDNGCSLLSSGVGSNVSGEMDSDTNAKSDISGSSSDGGSSKDTIFSSYEDLSNRNNIEDAGKPISQDVLNNIRAYGTSVTYYGGKIIASSKGYSCSPMTVTIMNEIKQSSPDYHANRKFLFDDKQLAKFKLVKSNSCGSRLGLSDTHEYGQEYEQKLTELQEDYNNNDVKRETNVIKEEEEEEEEKEEEELTEKPEQISQTGTKVQVLPPMAPEKKTIEDLWKDGEHGRQNSKSFCDMEFEEFQVLENS